MTNKKKKPAPVTPARYPWEQHFPSDNPWDQEITPAPVFDLFDQTATEFPTNIAVDFLGKKYSYAELEEQINRAAKGLQKLNVTKGTKVGLLLPNCPQYIILFFAILKVGGIVVSLNPVYPIKDLRHQIDDLGVTLIATFNLSVLYTTASKLLQSTTLEKIIIASFEETLPYVKSKLFSWLKRDQLSNVIYNHVNISYESMLENDGNYSPVEIHPESDTAILQYTGGTTGTPKGAILTHKNIYTNIRQCTLMMDIMEEGKESIMAVLPFFHIFAMTTVMGVGIAKGAKLIIHPKFELQKLLKDINQKSPTMLAAVPAIYTAINHEPTLARYNLHSLKICVSGGAALPDPVKEAFEKYASCTILEGYGLTENSPVATLNPPFAISKNSSIGIPLPNVVVKICDPEDTTKEMPIGKEGEICISGPQLMQGYYNQSDADNQQVIVNGMLRTGDIGYMDEEGYVFIIDRIKELIISGGTNIYPRTIESEVMNHHAIKEAAAIGVEDEYKGQVVKLYLVAKTGENCSDEEIQSYLSNKIAKYAMPKYIEWMESLPKTLIGKIDKKALQMDVKESQ